MRSIVLTPGAYAPQVRRWVPVRTVAQGDRTRDRITLATWNVWFAPDFLEERCAAALALLAARQPDVIAFQEVTPSFLEEVLRTPWIRSEYSLSDIRGDSIDPYGVLILSRLPVLDWQCHPLPSELGRHLVTARTRVNGTVTTVASTHLESRSTSAPTRIEQLAAIFPLLAADSHCILAGDFNFGAMWDENHHLDPSYLDVWPALHPTTAGYTEDTDRNRMRWLHTQKHKRVRFDRILLRSQAPGWRAESIQLIGTDPIGGALSDVFPSDHFGLIGTLAWHTGA